MAEDMQTVEFKYKIGDTVLIKGIQMKGTIEALKFCHVQEFLVAYWNNCERKNIWLEEWEIEPKN